MLNLDDLDSLKNADPNGYLAILANTAQLSDDVYQQFHDNFSPRFTDIKNIVVCAMGGSAIGADLASSVINKCCPVNIMIIRDYTLPGWIDDKTLVIANSYSGNTEETIGCYLQAIAKKAQVMVIASGGTLIDLAQKNQTPFWQLPSGLPPRSAWAFSYFILLDLLQKIGLLTVQDFDAKSMITEMKVNISANGPDIETANNPAKQIANSLFHKLPIIYGAEHLGCVARRWKGEFNENSKIPSYYEEFPELNHNSQQGQQCHDELKQILSILIISSELYHPRNQLRAKIIEDTFAEQGFDVTLINIGGANISNSIANSVILGDYISVYLAFLLGHDPVNVMAIENLKKMLHTGEYISGLIKE